MFRHGFATKPDDYYEGVNQRVAFKRHIFNPLSGKYDAFLSGLYQVDASYFIEYPSFYKQLFITLDRFTNGH